MKTVRVLVDPYSGPRSFQAKEVRVAGGILHLIDDEGKTVAQFSRWEGWWFESDKEQA